PTDRVLTVATAAPLEYYFKRNKVPIQYLRTPIAKANRIILIVMETKYSLDEVMGIARIPTDQFETHNKYVYDALKAHKAKTGLSLGINTSFNKHEEPIVCHPQDAVQELIRGGVDVLFVENYRVEKAS
ncbi:MAG: carbamoyltransferase C-terminal domain-containing protein, partial [Candidatus Latescibacteria bacterium]|nr:carbamoyltransferase C-terminal domain-containing protein [Candidatus Latescibacterota bacterium]